MIDISVRIPPSIEQHSAMFGMFIEGMLVKLDKNSWKDTPTINSIAEIIEQLEDEIDEFEDQMFGDPQHENALVELMDIANFAFLAYIALRRQGVNHAVSNVASQR